MPKTRLEGRCVSAGVGVVTKVDVSCSALAANAGASELVTTTMATASAVESLILSRSRDAMVLLLSSTENVKTLEKKMNSS